MPVLQKIEQDMMLHYKERHEIYTKRRLADDSDDLALCVGVAGVENEVEEVDEMGRTRRGIDDSGPYSNIRRARRQDRIARRERRASKLRKEQQEAGLSTDSELGEGDTQDYQTAQEALQVRVDNLSSDVKAEDFRDPQLGLAVRFGGWRRQYEEEYNNAYGGLAMVQGWEYWARQEMIGWEPGRVSLLRFSEKDCGCAETSPTRHINRLIVSTGSTACTDIHVRKRMSPNHRTRMIWTSTRNCHLVSMAT
jgi:GC-rich sequence DNA-binding factor